MHSDEIHIAAPCHLGKGYMDACGGGYNSKTKTTAKMCPKYEIWASTARKGGVKHGPRDERGPEGSRGGGGAKVRSWGLLGIREER